MAGLHIAEVPGFRRAWCATPQAMQAVHFYAIASRDAFERARFRSIIEWRNGGVSAGALAVGVIAPAAACPRAAAGGVS